MLFPASKKHRSPRKRRAFLAFLILAISECRFWHQQNTHLAQPRANYLRPDNPSSPALSHSLHFSTKNSTFFLCPYQKEKVSLPQISGNRFVPHCILPYTTSTIHRFSKTSATEKSSRHTAFATTQQSSITN